MTAAQGWKDSIPRRARLNRLSHAERITLVLPYVISIPRSAIKLRSKIHSMTPQELRQWIADSGWTQQQLADELEISRDLITRWLKGHPIKKVYVLALKGLSFIARSNLPTREGHYWLVYKDGSGFYETEVRVENGVVIAGTLEGKMLPVPHAHFTEYNWAGPIPEPVIE